MIWLDTTATRFDVAVLFALAFLNGIAFGWWLARARAQIRYHQRKQREAEVRLRELQGKNVN